MPSIIRMNTPPTWLPEQAWVAARGAADFSQFAPVLEEWVGLVREASALIDQNRPPYDVALEEFEKGMTAARLDEVFSQVLEGGRHVRTL